MRKKLLIGLVGILLVAICVAVLWYLDTQLKEPILQEIPAYTGEPYVVVDGNLPSFTEREKVTEAYEFYSELDAYNRCGYVMACIGPELMPTEDRGSIGQVKPTGWHTVKYDCVDGKYLYNRCHLIGYQLTGENANPQNLITGTRYLNIEGMLPFENMVADYIKETGNHVIYRVTPDFQGEDLLAKGVKLEGWSVEDAGEGICFSVYAYNVQPGVIIDYSTGESCLEESFGEPETTVVVTFILNISSKKFHAEGCGQGENTKPENKDIFQGDRDVLLEQGYVPAGCCNP